MRDVTAGDIGRAQTYVRALNLEIVKAIGAERQGHKRPKHDGAGEVGKTSIAATPLRATQIPNDTSPLAAPGTPPGYCTMVRQHPRILRRLKSKDPRVTAAELYIDTAERLAAQGGSTFGKTGPKMASSHGGVTTRVELSARLNLIEAYAKGWQVSGFGGITRGRPRFALRVGRQTGNLRNINVMDALELMIFTGRPVSQVLRMHGWTEESKARAALQAGVLTARGDVA